MPQVRQAAETFVPKLFPRGTKLLRTEPLRAMVIGAFVRGLSMRDVESLCEQAGLGAVEIDRGADLHRAARALCRLPAPRPLRRPPRRAVLDAIFLSVRPDGPKEGMLVAWGFTEAGERVLLAVMLGMREPHEDWLELGRNDFGPGTGAAAERILRCGRGFRAHRSGASSQPLGPRNRWR